LNIIICILVLFNFYFNFKLFKKYFIFHYKIIYIEYIMSLTGGKRKVNKSLKAWVAFVKKVQKEEKLSYKDAIHRAKVRKDKGEKWMTGGAETSTPTSTPQEDMDMDMGSDMDADMGSDMGTEMGEGEMATMGGRRRRRTMRKSRGRGRGRTARRSRGRASRRH
jgi:hypothetical protein